MTVGGALWPLRKRSRRPVLSAASNAHCSGSSSPGQSQRQSQTLRGGGRHPWRDCSVPASPLALSQPPWPTIQPQARTDPPPPTHTHTQGGTPWPPQGGAPLPPPPGRQAHLLDRVVCCAAHQQGLPRKEVEGQQRRVVCVSAVLETSQARGGVREGARLARRDRGVRAACGLSVTGACMPPTVWAVRGARQGAVARLSSALTSAHCAASLSQGPTG